MAALFAAGFLWHGRAEEDGVALWDATFLAGEADTAFCRKGTVCSCQDSNLKPWQRCTGEGMCRRKASVIIYTA